MGPSPLGIGDAVALAIALDRPRPLSPALPILERRLERRQPGGRGDLLGGPGDERPLQAVAVDMNLRDPVGAPATRACGRLILRPSEPTRSRTEVRMGVHLVPGELAGMLEVEEHVVITAARELDVPIYRGRIDSVLFAEAVIAAGHHLAPRAKDLLQAEGGP